eukprot:323318-Pyramimonas_sp.AAC.1
MGNPSGAESGQDGGGGLRRTGDPDPQVGAARHGRAERWYPALRLLDLPWCAERLRGRALAAHGVPAGSSTR